MKNGGDVTKHLATLSTGAIVFAATFQDKLKSAHRIPWAPAVAIGLIAISLITGVSCLLNLLRATSSLNALRDSTRAATVVKPHHRPKMDKSISRFNLWIRVCAWTFMLSMGLLSAFVIANAF